jgi:hypothetical protein
MAEAESITINVARGSSGDLRRTAVSSRMNRRQFLSTIAAVPALGPLSPTPAGIDPIKRSGNGRMSPHLLGPMADLRPWKAANVRGSKRFNSHQGTTASEDQIWRCKLVALRARSRK